MIKTLSFGGGVQSSTALLMMEEGEIERVDYAIFADTEGEPAAVYRWVDYIETLTSIPIIRVSAGSLEAREVRVRISKKSGLPWMKNSIPAFVDKGFGFKPGMLGRKCTLDFKITPITRKLRALAGIKRAPRDKSLVLVNQSLGISIDESLRAKPSRETWITHSFPLIDKGMTRADCFAWMKAHGYPEPPRSACRFCPFHSDAEWARLQREEPDDFTKAVEFERKIQSAAKGVLDGVPYLHSTLKPLDTVVFADRPAKPQVDMFNNECEGLCGV